MSFAREMAFKNGTMDASRGDENTMISGDISRIRAWSFCRASDDRNSVACRGWRWTSKLMKASGTFLHESLLRLNIFVGGRSGPILGSFSPDQHATSACQSAVRQRSIILSWTLAPEVAGIGH